MADTYFQTATSYGVTDNPVNVPPGATIITQAAYDAAIATQTTNLTTAATAALNQRKADYTTVYAALRSMGMPQAAVVALLKNAGMTDLPAVDPETNVKAMTQQSTAATFSHVIAAATNVFEKITEVADLTVQESGLYKIVWQAQGQVTTPANTPGTAQSAVTSAAAYKNGAIISGTETKLDGFVLGGSPSVNVPAHGLYMTGTGVSYQSLNSGDVISLYAKKVSGIASTHSIESSADGRTYIALERIRPA